MSPRKCKFFEECHADAIYQIPYSKLSLCKDHLLSNVQKRVRTLVEKKHMFHPNRNEKVLVAASGGKDSQVLLHILKHIYPENLEIHALYIDLGINSRQYSPDSLLAAQKLCKEYDYPFHVINIQKEYGMSIDEIHKLLQTYRNQDWINDKNSFRGMCSYCGSFKRYNINKFAKENGFTVVATGHNLTDETTQLVNNFFNVQLQFLEKTGPVNDSEMDELVPRVKPLFYISEDQIMMYAYYAQIPHNPTECPYAERSPTNKLKTVMKKIEENRPGNMITTMRRFQRVLKKPIQEHVAHKYSDEEAKSLCNRCGRPTFSHTCAFCRMLDSLNARFSRVKADLGIGLQKEPKNTI